MEVILMLGSVEDNGAAHLIRYLVQRAGGELKLVEIGDEFFHEFDKAEQYVSDNHSDLMDEGGEWSTEATECVKRILLGWTSNTHLGGAEPIDVAKWVAVIDHDHDWWPLTEIVGLDNVIEL